MADVDLSELAARFGGSQPLNAYLAVPDGDGPWPGVVMIHEIFGLDRVIRGHADRLARAGYLVVAPDLFSTGGMRRCLRPTMRAMAAGVGRPYADIEAARAWLLASLRCTGRLGVIGFCLGGGFALMTAGSGFEVAGAHYGHLPQEPDDALDGVCPIVASYGGRDRTLRGAAARLDSVLDRLGVEHDVKEYPAAGHAFMTPQDALPRPLRPLLRVAGFGADPESADDAWRRTEAFFREHLG
jgi:carboxymethylenebutenolidase